MQLVSFVLRLCLLGLILFRIELQRIIYGGKYRVFCQVIEKDTIEGLVFGSDLLSDMPSDGLSLTVRVRSEIDFIGLFCGFFQFGYDLPLFFYDLVGRLKVLLYIDSELTLWKILDVTQGCLYFKFRTEVLLNCLYLRR